MNPINPVRGGGHRSTWTLDFNAKWRWVEVSTHSKAGQVFVKCHLVGCSVLAKSTMVSQGEIVVHPIRIKMGVVFSAERGSISLPTHDFVKVSFEKRVFPVVICPRMSRAGIPTRQHTHTCRKASGHRCVRSIKPGAPCGETIQKRRGIELKSFTPGYIGTLLIRHDHDDIRFRSHVLHPIGSAELLKRYRVPVLQTRQPLRVPSTAHRLIRFRRRKDLASMALCRTEGTQVPSPGHLLSPRARAGTPRTCSMRPLRVADDAMDAWR